uniref:Uncharacterized protein n=1 Tax=Anopheles culicifacies TaxID=139723 RepID=A0A182LX77_9DIPT
MAHVIAFAFVAHKTPTAQLDVTMRTMTMTQCPKVSKLQSQTSTTSASSTSSLNELNFTSVQQTHNGATMVAPHQQQQIALFVCIAGDSTSRSRYQFYIDDTFRYVLGHLVTAFELYEEKRVRDQCQNLLQVARRLLGKIVRKLRREWYANHQPVIITAYPPENAVQRVFPFWGSGDEN